MNNRVLMLGVVVCMGCASTPTRHSGSKVVTAPTIELLDAGKEPRRALRFVPTVGRQETMLITNAMSVAFAIGREEMPPPSPWPAVLMTADMTTTARDADGTFTSEFVVRAARIDPDPTFPIEAAVALQDAAEPLVGLKGSSRVNDRGITLEADVATPDRMDDVTRQLLDTVKGSVTQVGIALPAEAVGVGASWRVVTQIGGGFMAMRQSAFVQLVGLAGNEVTLRVTLDQTAPPQRMQSNGDSTVDLVSLSSTGKGDIQLDLARLVPIGSTLDLTTELVTKSVVDGEEMLTRVLTMTHLDVGQP